MFGKINPYMILRIDSHNKLDPFETAIETAASDWPFAEQIQLVDTVTGNVCRNMTKVSLFANADHLFIRFVCFTDAVFSYLTKRNSNVWEEEVAEVFLQPPGMENYYFELDVNPNNAVADLYIRNDERQDGSKNVQAIKPWTCKNLETRIFVKGKLNEKGGAQYWIAEYKIPFVSLELQELNQAQKCWKANFYRIDRSEKETEYHAWNPTGKIDFHMMEKFTSIMFIKD
ncbi:MAG: carbohydrate-binding family 9-like protein [Bacteroidetes bacterium]|nr:carbohydrate-binding family 9-like protein [Bacteroidota bacterium]